MPIKPSSRIPWSGAARHSQGCRMKVRALPSSSELAMHQAPRCKARSKRTGKPCRSPAVRLWAVCRMHGSRGGAPKAEANGNYKTGEHTAEVREARRLVRAILRRAKEAEAIV